jgi:hypothetical protein
MTAAWSSPSPYGKKSKHPTHPPDCRPDQGRLYSMTTASAYSGSVTTNTLTNANCFISPSVSLCAVEHCRPRRTTTTHPMQELGTPALSMPY